MNEARAKHKESRTNEELVALIQAGQRELLPKLWEQVERYVSQQAGKLARILQGTCGVTGEDLYQSGYLALVAATESYEQGRGMKFIGWLTLHLKTSFAEAGGWRSQKRDPLTSAASLDVPINDDPGMTLNNCLPDYRTVAPFLLVEEDDYTHTARRTILAALDTVCDERKRRLITGMYFEGHTMTRAAELAGYTCKQGACQDYKWILRRLLRCSYTRSLRDLLNGYADTDIYADGIRGTGLKTWRISGKSATERAAEKLCTYKI